MVNLSRKISNLRTHLNMTQGEFARKIGITRSNLSQIAIGNSKPRQILLEKIVKQFSIDANYFFFDDLDLNKNQKYESIPDKSVAEEPISSYNEDRVKELERKVAFQKEQMDHLYKIMNDKDKMIHSFQDQVDKLLKLLKS